MNFKAFSLLILFIAQNICTIVPENSTVTPVVKIDINQVRAAEEQLAWEAQWIPVTNYAAIGLTSALTAYVLYNYFFPKESALDQIKAAMEQGYTEFANSVKNFKSDQDFESKVEYAFEISRKEFIDDIAKSIDDIAKSLYTGTTKKDGFYSIKDGALAAASTVGGWFQSGANWIGPMIAFNYLRSKYERFASVIPQQHTLTSYIAKQASFFANQKEIFDAFAAHMMHAADFPIMIQGIVYDAEKILGYIHHFKTLIQPDQVYILLKTDRYIRNIEIFTNNLVDAVNNYETVNIVFDKFKLLNGEITNARSFFDARV